LGLAYARQQRGAEALDALAEASRLAPDNRRFAFVYAVALNSGGRSAEAIDVLVDALGRAPWDRDLLVGLATFHRDRRELPEAVEYARRLVQAWPDDQGALQLLTELESTGG
jgi:cytochrome c-type biogenesis protein CcmH/NrfG